MPRKPTRKPAAVEDVLDEEEMRRIVAALARGGNMPACRFYWETWIRPTLREGVGDGLDPLAEVDELARRRAV
jgi:hypothetical protein